jgi:hypothetical protein
VPRLPTGYHLGVRIALVAPLVTPISDRETPIGGAQAFVVDLTHALQGAGHTVTLLAAEGSHVAGAEVPALGIDSRRLTPARFDLDTVARVRSDLEEQRQAGQQAEGGGVVGVSVHHVERRPGGAAAGVQQGASLARHRR